MDKLGEQASINREVVIQKPEIEQEFDFPYLKIPNGIPSEEEHRYMLDEENEPSEDELRVFFKDHPDAVGRLVYCPEINRDLTDSWGIEGFEPGFLFVVAKKYSGKATIADETFLRRALENPLRTASGVDVPQIPNYADFPQNKYLTQFITARRTPRTFHVVNEMLQTPKPPAIGQ